MDWIEGKGMITAIILVVVIAILIYLAAPHIDSGIVAGYGYGG